MTTTNSTATAEFISLFRTVDSKKAREMRRHNFRKHAARAENMVPWEALDDERCLARLDETHLPDIAAWDADLDEAHASERYAWTVIEPADAPTGVVDDDPRHADVDRWKLATRRVEETSSARHEVRGIIASRHVAAVNAEYRDESRRYFEDLRAKIDRLHA